MTQLIIFSDLDGTLLDTQTYSYAAASDALAKIKALQIPLILISSKTRAELMPLQRELGLTAPFVCENGAAIFWQKKSHFNGKSLWQSQAFVPERSYLLAQLHELRKAHEFQFTGFNDCSLSELVDLTDLAPAQAELAAQREYTEPLLWRDTPERLELFKTALIERGLHAEQGGRFLSVMGKCDKSAAMAVLIERYRAQGPIISMALGDSFNDEAMLQAADVAVVIKSTNSAKLKITQPQWVVRTIHEGPQGWQEAMDIVLPVMGSNQQKIIGQ
jgi:mannosyl-3-phosphoglycerate phosphatase